MSCFVPPVSFGMVEYDLTRSGMVHSLNFPFLARLQLRTLLYLSHEDPSPEFLDFIEQQGIKLLRPNPEQGRELAAEVLSTDQVLSALEVIVSPEYYPLHIMCRLGVHMTGTVVGCLRKVQKWNLTSIFEEHRRYAGTKVRVLNEQFIEMFDVTSLRIPSDHPEWL